MTTAQEFLESSGGGDYPSFSWKDTPIGTTIKGVILNEPRPFEGKDFDGNPETTLPVNLDTADGPQTLWIRAGFLAGAVKDAVKEAGAPGLQVGGTLAVKFVEERETKYPKPARVFKAKYEAPASNGVDVDDIF